MATKINNIKEFKDKKKYEKIVNDIGHILNVLNLAQRGLAHFKIYVAVQEIISVLETNKTMLELQRKHYENKLVEIKKKSTE